MVFFRLHLPLIFGIEITKSIQSAMLILTHCKEESVIINGNIKVKVLGIDPRGQVRLAFVAPDEVDIVREELLKED